MTRSKFIVILDTRSFTDVSTKDVHKALTDANFSVHKVYRMDKPAEHKSPQSILRRRFTFEWIDHETEEKSHVRKVDTPPAPSPKPTGEP